MINSNINTRKFKVQAVYGNEVVIEKEMYVEDSSFEALYYFIRSELLTINSSYYLPVKSDCEFFSSENSRVTKEGGNFEAEATYTVKLLKKPQVEEQKQEEAKQEEEAKQAEEIKEEEEKEVDQSSYVSGQVSSSHGMGSIPSSFEMPQANEIGRVSPFLNPEENIPPNTPIIPSIANSTEKLSETKETHN